MEDGWRKEESISLGISAFVSSIGTGVTGEVPHAQFNHDLVYAHESCWFEMQRNGKRFAKN
jgi:hypothetical protein